MDEKRKRQLEKIKDEQERELMLQQEEIRKKKFEENQKKREMLMKQKKMEDEQRILRLMKEKAKQAAADAQKLNPDVKAPQKKVQNLSPLNRTGYIAETNNEQNTSAQSNNTLGQNEDCQFKINPDL